MIHLFLTKADIFHIISKCKCTKPLKDLCTRLMQICCRYGSVAESWHTYGDSDITTFIHGSHGQLTSMLCLLHCICIYSGSFPCNKERKSWNKNNCIYSWLDSLK